MSILETSKMVLTLTLKGSEILLPTPQSKHPSPSILNSSPVCGFFWVFTEYEGWSTMFVIWPRNFTYCCTGQNQEYVSSDTPCLHITLKTIPKVYTMIVQYAFWNGGQYDGTNGIIFTEPTWRVPYIIQVECRYTQIWSVIGLNVFRQFTNSRRGWLSLSAVMSHSGPSSIQTGKWHPWPRPISTRFINS